MKNAVIYLTRRCPRHCSYCKIRDGKGVGKELTTKQWFQAFQILKELEVEFNLILGNEPWLLGTDLLKILLQGTPYGLYTAGNPKLFFRQAPLLFGGGIDNLSIGVDFPKGLSKVVFDDDSYQKSVDAWKIIEYTRQNYPHIQVHATVTIHKLNASYVPNLVTQLTNLGVFSNLNFIHWDKDGGYDFFFPSDKMVNLLFSTEDYANLRDILTSVVESPNLLQNPEMLREDIDKLVEMKWHCEGDPYGGPTIDADGTLRVCGYRKGTRTPKFTIFDLPKSVGDWKVAVQEDAKECPGCSWSCAWMYNYWKRVNPEIGSKVFERHETRR